MKFGKSSGKPASVSDVSRVLSAAKDSGGSRNIPLNLIDIEKNVRSSYPNIPEFAATLKAEGLRHAITLLLKPNGRYRIVAGHRRYLAYEYNGEKTIESTIVKPFDSLQERKIQISENTQREQLSVLDEVRGVAEDDTLFGRENAKAIWGRSPTEPRDDAWISRRVTLAKADELVLKLAESGALTDIESLLHLNKALQHNREQAILRIKAIQHGEFFSRKALSEFSSSLKTEKLEKQTKDISSGAELKPEKQAATLAVSGNNESHLTSAEDDSSAFKVTHSELADASKNVDAPIAPARKEKDDWEIWSNFVATILQAAKRDGKPNKLLTKLEQELSQHSFETVAKTAGGEKPKKWKL